MIKIVAGIYRSRQIETPSSGTLPTKNFVREALFSSLGEKVKGARVLDLFAGSGALGIEAISRGASFCHFVDASKESADVIRRNLKSLGIENAEIRCMDYLDALKELKDERFDLVFLDPPYANKEAYVKAVEALLASNRLQSDGVLVLEYEGDLPPIPGEFAKKEKRYGKTKLLILRKETI